MTLDRHAAERRRFVRLLGVDEELGSGLPIGSASRRSERERDHQRQRRRDRDGIHHSERKRDDVVSASDAPADGAGSAPDLECDLESELTTDIDRGRNASSDSPAE